MREIDECAASELRTELDMLIEYFKEKKKLLDEAAGKPFQSNGQTYYWISRDLLP